jgi:hypothetical protein
VSCGIAIGARSVSGNCQHLVVLVDDASAHWDLTQFLRSMRGRNCSRHPLLIDIHIQGSSQESKKKIVKQRKIKL